MVSGESRRTAVDGSQWQRWLLVIKTFVGSVATGLRQPDAAVLFISNQVNFLVVVGLGGGWSQTVHGVKLFSSYILI
jgi:hypothetical protein